MEIGNDMQVARTLIRLAVPEPIDPSESPRTGMFMPKESVSFTRPLLYGDIWYDGDFDRADAQAIIDGVEVVGDVDDPTTWPARPVG